MISFLCDNIGIIGNLSDILHCKKKSWKNPLKRRAALIFPFGNGLQNVEVSLLVSVLFPSREECSRLVVGISPIATGSFHTLQTLARGE